MPLISVLSSPRRVAPPPASGGFVIHAGGTTDPTSTANGLATTEKQSLTDGTITAGTNLVSARYGTVSASDYSHGLFAGGQPTSNTMTTNTDKYKWSDGVCTSTTALSQVRKNGQGMSNSTFALMVGGYTTYNYTGSVTNITEKYNWSDFSRSTAANLNASQAGYVDRGGNASASNASKGATLYGVNNNFSYLTTVDKYNMSSNVWTLQTTSGTNQKRFTQALTNTTVAVTSGGAQGTTMVGQMTKWDYAAETIATNASMGTARDSSSAAGDATIGYIAGGKHATLNATTNNEKYTFADSSMVASTALNTARSGPSGASSSPGGF